MNIKINNISFRIENEGFITREIYVKKDNEEDEMEEFTDVVENEGGMREKRKLSTMSETSSRKRRSSSKISVSEKPFALGFCIK